MSNVDIFCGAYSGHNRRIPMKKYMWNGHKYQIADEDLHLYPGAEPVEKPVMKSAAKPKNKARKQPSNKSKEK